MSKKDVLYHRRTILKNLSLSAIGTVLPGSLLSGCKTKQKRIGAGPPSSKDASTQFEPSVSSKDNSVPAKPKRAPEKDPGAKAEYRDILVVGAGMAGISAARALRLAGHKVLLLEGRDRMGGRIHTFQRWGVTLEEGAQWVNGSKTNPLGPLLSTFQLKSKATDFESFTMFQPDGRACTTTELTAIESAYERLGKQMLAFRGPKDRSAASFLNALRVPASTRSLLTYLLESDYGADSEILSALESNLTRGYRGPDLWMTGGAVGLVKALAKGLDIRLSHTIKKIDTSGKGVKVYTHNGKVFAGKSVIVTVPLSILQNPRGTAGIEFVPPLPKQKQAAITEGQFGVLNKVFIRFKKNFWGNQTHFFALLSNKIDDFIAFFNHGYAQGEPILTGYIPASFAREVAGWSDDKILETILQKFSKAAGRVVSSKEVMGMHISRWGKDPFSLGCYSFSKVGHFRWRSSLASPIGKKLLFAGEACSTVSPGTMQGAYLSGLKAAKLLAG